MKKWFSVFSLPAALFSPCALLAQEGQEVAAPASNSWQTLMMIGIALVFFYFILWRPEQKRRKAMENLRDSMKKGDRVTAMGIVGELVKANPEGNTVILKMYDGSQIEVLKAAISEVKSADVKESGSQGAPLKD